MDIKNYQKNPQAFFSALKSRPELVEKFGNRIYQFDQFDKGKACSAFALFLCFTSSELKQSKDNEEYMRAFFKLCFNERLNISSGTYFDEAKRYLERAFKHLLDSDKYKEIFEGIDLKSVSHTKSKYDINILVRPFRDASQDIKFTLVSHCMIAMILSDIYESVLFRNLKIICDNLDITTQDRWSLISPIMKVGSLKLKDVNELTEKDKMFIYIAMIKDLYENDGQIDEVELQTIDRIEKYLTTDPKLHIDAKDYITRSFVMASHLDKRKIDERDAKIMIYLAMQVIGLDGVQDVGEIRMLKKIIGIFEDEEDPLINIAASVPEDASLNSIKEEDRLYGLLTILQMILADDEIQKEEMEYLYGQLKLIMNKGKIKSTDTDLLCFLEIIFSYPKWSEKYNEFFNIFQNLYTNHIKKEQLIVRIISSYYFLTRQKKADRINEGFVTTLSKIFELNIENNKTIKSLAGLKVYEDNFNVDEDRYLLISFVFILKSLIHNFDINPQNSNLLMGGIMREVNKHVPLTRYHTDTYKFLFGWI